MKLFRTSTSFIWFLLVSATAVSWWLGTEFNPAAQHYRPLTTISILLIAFIKIRFVIMHFMEVRNAPWLLVLLCNAWVILVFSAVTGLYLIMPH